MECHRQTGNGGCGQNTHVQAFRLVLKVVDISVVFSVVITAITCILTPEIVRLMDIPLDIAEEAEEYLFVVLAGTGATVLYNLISNILRSMGDSRLPLIFLVLSSILNIFLDILFIVPF